MSIDTLKFVEQATDSGFTEKQAKFLSNEINGISKEKVGNEYLDQRFKQFGNEMTIRLGGLLIVWTTLSLTILGFILKH